MYSFFKGRRHPSAFIAILLVATVRMLDRHHFVHGVSVYLCTQIVNSPASRKYLASALDFDAWVFAQNELR